MINIEQINDELDIPGGVITTHCVSSVIKPGSKQNHDPLQFVKIQSNELSRKAVEQIRLAEEVKITKEKIKEVEEEWQNNLLNWKSKRRQTRGNSSLDDDDTISGDQQVRKVKTFSEIIKEKAKSGHRIGYNLHKYLEGEDEFVHHFSDVRGIDDAERNRYHNEERSRAGQSLIDDVGEHHQQHQRNHHHHHRQHHRNHHHKMHNHAENRENDNENQQQHHRRHHHHHYHSHHSKKHNHKDENIETQDEQREQVENNGKFDLNFEYNEHERRLNEKENNEIINNNNNNNNDDENKLKRNDDLNEIKYFQNKEINDDADNRDDDDDENGDGEEDDNDRSENNDSNRDDYDKDEQILSFKAKLSAFESLAKQVEISPKSTTELTNEEKDKLKRNLSKDNSRIIKDRNSNTNIVNTDLNKTSRSTFDENREKYINNDNGSDSYQQSFSLQKHFKVLQQHQQQQQQQQQQKEVILDSENQEQGQLIIQSWQHDQQQPLQKQQQQKFDPEINEISDRLNKNSLKEDIFDEKIKINDESKESHTNNTSNININTLNDHDSNNSSSSSNNNGLSEMAITSNYDENQYYLNDEYMPVNSIPVNQEHSNSVKLQQTQQPQLQLLKRQQNSELIEKPPTLPVRYHSMSTQSQTNNNNTNNNNNNNYGNLGPKMTFQNQMDYSNLGQEIQRPQNVVPEGRLGFITVNQQQSAVPRHQFNSNANNYSHSNHSKSLSSLQQTSSSSSIPTPASSTSSYNLNHWIIQEAELRRQLATCNNNNNGNQYSSNKPVAAPRLNKPVIHPSPPPPPLPPHHHHHQLHHASSFPSISTNPSNINTNNSGNSSDNPLYENTSLFPSISLKQAPPTSAVDYQQQLQQQQQKRMLSVSGRKKCSSCGDELGRGCAAMVIESLSLYYHINCFRCSVCHIQLGNGTCGTDVRVRNNKLHCKNCYSNDEG